MSASFHSLEIGRECAKTKILSLRNMRGRIRSKWWRVMLLETQGRIQISHCNIGNPKRSTKRVE